MNAHAFAFTLAAALFTVAPAAAAPSAESAPVAAELSASQILDGPRGAVVVRHRGRAYHVTSGRYYQRDARGRFVVVRPPAGLVVASLPRGATVVRIGGRRHHRYAGVTYRPVRGGFVVVHL